MAQTIPLTLPEKATHGEVRLFNLLKRLPEDVVVYYEPSINNRHPDFVIILPSCGVLLMEVKGWTLSDIKGADTYSIKVSRGGHEEVQKHPLRQVDEYKYLLMDRCRKDKWLAGLVNFSGRYAGKFRFPFASCALLSSITRNQLGRWHEKSKLVFPPTTVATKDQLEVWETLSPQALLQDLRRYFRTFQLKEPMTSNQVNIVKAILHPEIFLGLDFGDAGHPGEPTVKVLDLKQERLARQIGEGHRLVFGVAGSGKTVLLIARAKLLAQLNPKSHILILCYNFMLASYLHDTLSGYPAITVKHFHRWARENGVYHGNQTDSQVGLEFLEQLKNPRSLSRGFDSILIDEAQDFDSTWYPCVLAAMKDPTDGELLIVGDGSQGLYRRRKLSWKQLGIQAVGRTQYLEQNYRNTRPMLRLAKIFATKKTESDDDLGSPWVDPEKCLRITGSSPILLQRRTKQNEVERVVRVVCDLLDGRWFGETILPLKPHQIAILYRIRNQEAIQTLREKLEVTRKDCPVIWLSETKATRNQLGKPGVKILTMHASKGLQFKAVIVIFADACPAQFIEGNEDEERALFYVALTRAEDHLAISCTGTSQFIQEIEAASTLDALSPASI